MGKFGRVQGKSKTECDRILYPDQTGTVVRFTADDETMALLKRLSELTAIRASDPAALIKRIAKIALGAIDPLAGKKPRKTAPPAELAKTAKAAPPAELAAKPGPLSSRYVDVATKRQVWIRDNGQCAYVDSLSRRSSSSSFGLQKRKPERKPKPAS